MSQLRRSIFALVILLLIIAAGYYFSDIIAFILIAWVLALLGRPIMDFLLVRLNLGKYRAGPALASLVTLSIFLVIVLILIWLFVPPFIAQALSLRSIDFASIYSALREPFDALESTLIAWGIVEAQGQLEEQFSQIVNRWFSPAKVGGFFTSFVGAAGFLLFAVFSIVYVTFFFLKESGLLGSFIFKLTPQKYENEVDRVMRDSTMMLTRYFGGVVIQVAAITIFLWLALSLFGIKNALLIGFFAALMNVIPYLGVFIGAIFAVLMSVPAQIDISFYAHTLPLILKIVGVFILMQLLDNFLLQPIVFAKSVKAHPLEIFIVILIGARIGQIPGMILAIPVYTVIRVITGVFFNEFRLFQKKVDDP